MSVINKEGSDVSWLLDKSRDYVISENPYAAKAWLLTAKSLYPKEFCVQYEEYFMERKSGIVEKCGKLFYEMMNQFPNEKILWDELTRIFYAQDPTRPENAESKFLKSMFDSLPLSHQKELLLKYANHQNDLIDKCRISLLVLKRFKGATSDDAVNLITTLKAAEDKEYPSTPLNIYRKMIVCDVVPLILKSSDTHIVQQVPKYKTDTLFLTEGQLVYYLNLTMEFFIAYAVDKYSLTKNMEAENGSQNIEGLELVEDGSSWHMLHENLVLFGTKLNWTNLNKFKDKIDPAKNRPLKSRWKTLNNAKDNKTMLGIFYPLLQLHLYCVLEYCSVLKTSSNNISSPCVDASDNEFVLVESIGESSPRSSTHGVIRTPKRKKKSDEMANQSSDYLSSSEEVKVVIHPGLISHVTEVFGECLMVAIETQNLLKSSFYPEYSQISRDWNMENWKWMTPFDIDALLYQSKYRAVIEKLSTKASTSPDERFTHSPKRFLQLSSAMFCAGQRRAACENALQAVSMLRRPMIRTTNTNLIDKKTSKHEGRYLILLSCNSNDVLAYAVQVLFCALKTRLYCEDQHRDAVIGHLIVLSQLMWSKNQQFFLHLLKLIEAQDGGFRYNLFFNYVTQVDILEEFAFKHSQGSIPLELLPTNKASSSKKTTVTRGVNREVEVDFRTAMERQVIRSTEPIQNVIHDFLCNERQVILDSLSEL